jgi:hypothetical protein
VIAVEDNFTGNRNAGMVGAEVVGAGLKIQRCRNTNELGFRTAVEEALGLHVVATDFRKSNSLDVLDMWETPRAANRPGGSLSHAPGSPTSGPPLPLMPQL